MESHDPVIQLHRRAMGYPYNADAVRNAANNGLVGPRRTMEQPKYQWPNYDGTDRFDHVGTAVLNPQEVVEHYEQVVNRDSRRSAEAALASDYLLGDHEIAPEILEDTEAMLQILDGTTEEIHQLEIMYQESRLKKSDFDPHLLELVNKIEMAEHAVNDQLRAEHPKWTAAIDAWLDRDSSDVTVSDEDKTTATLSFYEDLSADITSEKRVYEEELMRWIESGQNTARQSELRSGLAYYDGMLEVCEHRRIEALAGVNTQTLQRLYRLAA